MCATSIRTILSQSARQLPFRSQFPTRDLTSSGNTGQRLHSRGGDHNVYALVLCIAVNDQQGVGRYICIPSQNSIATSYSALVLFSCVHLVSLSLAGESEKVGQPKYMDRTIVFPSLCLLPNKSSHLILMLDIQVASTQILVIFA